jgi:hypothetical protein
MPLRDLLLEHLIHKLMLFNHRQPLELGRFNFDGVHGPASAAYVLDLWVVVLVSVQGVMRCDVLTPQYNVHTDVQRSVGFESSAVGVGSDVVCTSSLKDRCKRCASCHLRG